jgi:PAS domain S-box-containing protein
MTLARRDDGIWIAANDAVLALIGRTRDEVLGRDSVQIGVMDAERRKALRELLAGGGGLRSVVIDLKARSGEIRTVVTSTHEVEFDGLPCVLSTALDITERKRLDDFRSGQNRILERMTTGAPLDEILVELLRLAEGRSPGMLGSVLLLGKDGRRILRGIAPSLPGPFVSAFNGFPIGPKSGSCGTAMHRGETVIVEDIASDPLWEEYRAAAAGFGLRACWSMPIRSRTGEVLGSFAMYYREPRLPLPAEMELLAAAVHMAGLALEKDRVESQLRQVE